jgi:Zn-dependent M28 family amino/carboxypeptidase
MVASPNGMLQRYGPHSPPAFPTGSDIVDKVLEEGFRLIGAPSHAGEANDMSGSSDHEGFRLLGIPIGGIFSGASQIKTPEHAVLYGGTAGLPYDPCYHQACDTLDNIHWGLLEISGKVVSHSILKWSMNTQELNGVQGNKKFGYNPPAIGTLSFTEGGCASHGNDKARNGVKA